MGPRKPIKRLPAESAVCAPITRPRSVWLLAVGATALAAVVAFSFLRPSRSAEGVAAEQPSGREKAEAYRQERSSGPLASSGSEQPFVSSTPKSLSLSSEPESTPESVLSLSKPAAVSPEPAEAPPEPESPPSAAPPEPAEPVPVPPGPTSTQPGMDYVPPATIHGLEREAFEVAGRLLKEFPDHTDPIGLMGTLHNHLGNTAKAMRYWQRCLERNPNRPDIYRAMGRLSLSQGNYEEAAADARKAVEINPRLPGARAILAEAMLGLNRPKEAIAALEEEIRGPSAPDQDDWLGGDYCLAGRAYQQLAEHEKARENYQKAIRIQPDCTEAYYGLASVCARLGQADEAREHMKKFKALKAEKLTAHLHRRSQQTDIDWVRRVVASTHTGAGAVYRGHRKLREAEEHWRKAAILDPSDVACRRELALLYQRTGRNKEALEICEQLRKIDPKDASYQFNTGVLHARMNQIGSALVAVRRAMELDPDNAKYRRVYEQIRTLK